MNKLQKPLAVQAATIFFCLVCVSNADAEIRTITATGEYRMGDNDTRTDAKRLALLDAKRLALEQAGTYIDSITQVKNFDLSKEEIRAYTAGILEVTEQATRTTMEGETTVVRVDVTVKIDTDVVARQIDALRKNESVKAELTRLRAEGERLQREVEIKTRELAALRSKADVEAVTQQRQALIAQATVSDLLGKADTALLDFRSSHIDKVIKKTPAYDKVTVEALARARNYTEQALTINAFNARAQEIMAEILSLEGDVLDDKGEHEAAANKFRSATNLRPNHAWYHHKLAMALLRMGDVESALTESRTAQRLDPKEFGYTFDVGMVLAFTGDVIGAATVFRTMKLPFEPDKQYFRHYIAGMTLMNIEEVSEAPTMIKVREKLPKKKLKEAALKEFREYLLLAPDTPESQEWIKDAQAKVRELEQ